MTGDRASGWTTGVRPAALATMLLAVAAVGCGTARPAARPHAPAGHAAPVSVRRCFTRSSAVIAVADHVGSTERFGFERQISLARSALGVTLRSRLPDATMHGGEQRLELLFTSDARAAKRLRDRLINLVAGYGGGIPPGYDGAYYPLDPPLITAEGPVVEAFLGLDPSASQRRLTTACVHLLAASGTRNEPGVADR